MAQIDFFADESDLKRIWQFLFSDLRIVAYPDPYFGDLPVPAMRDPSEVVAHLGTYPPVAPGLGYFLTSSEWSNEPLVYRACDFNPHFGRYSYVSQRNGGPAIHFIPRFGYPGERKDSDLISGMFGDYPSYYLATGNEVPRPETLSMAMQRIRSALRALGGFVRSSDGRRAIALSGALSAHKTGALLRQGDIVYTANKAFQRTRSKQRAAES